MIEINLIVGKKPFKMPQVMGIDLAHINFKMLGLAFALSFLPDMLLKNDWENQKTTAQTEIDELSQKLKSVEKKVDKFKGVQDQVDALNKQEKKLKERLDVVKQIIKLKNNPSNVLLYIAKNIPEDVWLLNLEIVDKTIRFKGQSLNYKSIGIFIENLKSAIFFNKDIAMVSSRTIESKENAGRVEEFEITGTIARFE